MRFDWFGVEQAGGWSVDPVHLTLTPAPATCPLLTVQCSFHSPEWSSAPAAAHPWFPQSICLRP